MASGEVGVMEVVGPFPFDPGADTAHLCASFCLHPVTAPPNAGPGASVTLAHTLSLYSELLICLPVAVTVVVSSDLVE